MLSLRLVSSLLAANFLVAPAAERVSGARSAPAVETPRPIHATRFRLPRLFGDGMVLQRGKPIVVWGWATPNATVSVAFHGRSSHTTAANDGRWRASLPAQRAGGPFELIVGSGPDSIRLHDILIGDVWVASGQSNMEFELKLANNAEREIAGAHDSALRQFKVPNSYSDNPEDDLAGGSWVPADPQHAGDFTAVGYFFARQLRASTHVPIGIINTTWGGSNIETWISRPAQHIDDAQWAEMRRADDAKLDAIRNTLRAKLGDLPMKDAGLVDGRAAWADPMLDESSWSSIRVPAYWEGEGYPGMDGIAWYRTTLTLSDAQASGDATLDMTAIDDDDITWINGREVGRTAGYNIERAYRIPTGVLHAGQNVIAVRVTDGGGGGGINGDVKLTLANGESKSLAGQWKFKVGEVSFKPDGQQINKMPSILYNKMVNPLLPFPIKGVIWYQGESNSNNLAQARAYRDQFQTLIKSWRHTWDSHRDDFPFLWVQLPNYTAANPEPPSDAEAAWAAQRESMEAALALPHTGRAIAIDLGGADQLHPKNKQDVGDRLARVARAVVYGEHIAYLGPTYKSHRAVGDTVIIEFSHAAGLMTTGHLGSPGGFAIAGGDKHFVWAKATIVGRTVHVWSDHVHGPVAVRYAWANNPVDANLYNGERLPAAPFRTDSW